MYDIFEMCGNFIAFINANKNAVFSDLLRGKYVWCSYT